MAFSLKILQIYKLCRYYQISFPGNGLTTWQANGRCADARAQPEAAGKSFGNSLCLFAVNFLGRLFSLSLGDDFGHGCRWYAHPEHTD